MATSVTGVGSISSTGLGSGLDVTSIITKLMAIEQKPLNDLQTQATTLNTKLSNVGKMQGYFADLQAKSNALTDTTLWGTTTASSADSSAVKVTTTTGATAGNYDINVSKLATGQTVTSNALAADATLNQGTLTIELGTYGAGTPAADFTTKAGSSPITISIGAGDTSLTSVRDKINAAGAGVVASIVTDASGARLSLRSKDTGADSAFRITTTETVDDGNAATGLSQLGFDATQADSPMSRTGTAANAELTVNGIALTSASNTLTNVVDGITLNLLKPTTSAVAVTVSPDTASVKTAVTNFVTAFNTLASFIATQTAYDATAKKGGPLQGDQATLALQNQLRNVINQSSGASGSWSRLSEIGLTLKADGTLDTNSTKLDNALGNLPELKKLLSGDATSSANTGFIRRFKNLADAALGADGVFATRTASIQSNVTRNSKDQDALQKRLDQTQARLQAQYSALDTTMAKMNTLSTYMTQQITQMNKTGA